MKLTIKPWIYKDAQGKAQHYNFTLIWEHACFNAETGNIINNVDIDDIQQYVTEKGYTRAYNLFGEVTRETEKAVLLECKYWNLNRAGRYVTDAPVCDGFKVWIPKSAVYAVNNAPFTGVILEEVAV